MTKMFFIFLFVFFAGNICFAQKNKLIIEGTAPGMYLIHKVTPKENFYSIGRMYNVPPKVLAAYNNLQFVNGLSIGQLLKIPLSETNFTQSKDNGGNEAIIPLYHSVVPREGLYRVSIKFNKVPLDDLRKWNHLHSDVVSIGTDLIVGYLKVDKNESPLAGQGVHSDQIISTGNEGDNKPAPPNTDENHERLPPVKVPQKDQEEKKQEVPAQTEAPKEEVAAPENTKNTIDFSGGYFKNTYTEEAGNKSPVNEIGSAGVFKSTSGWQDGKYYCFTNKVPQGSIIKITYYSSGKSIYAKVLDAIPDIKQNSGLAVIISNAAADELGAGDRFECFLTYVK